MREADSAQRISLRKDRRAEIDQDDMRRAAAHGVDGGETIGAHRDDLEILFGGQQNPERLAVDRVLADDEDSSGTRASVGRLRRHGRDRRVEE